MTDYELAIRHVVRKPLVQLIEEGEDVPFDVATIRTIKLDYRDLASADNARQELIRQMQSAEKNPELVDNPISTTLKLALLQASAQPHEQHMGEVLAAIAQLTRDVHSLRRSSELGSAFRRWTEAASANLPIGNTPISTELSDAPAPLVTIFGAALAQRLLEIARSSKPGSPPDNYTVKSA